MANEIVKVYYPDGQGNMQFAYCETRGSFHQFVENINSFVGRIDMDAYAFQEGAAMQRYSMYWVDEDNDKVTIKCDYSLRIFLNKTNGLKKVYIVEKGSQQEALPAQPNQNGQQSQQKQSAPTTSSPASAGNAATLPLHQGVQCDNCDVIPIAGFRYKCAQCYDYDLCEKCEQKKAHGDHVMYRFPVPLPRHTELNRRFFKKLRHSGLRATTDSEGERPRKCGRRRHESNNTSGGAANAFSNFYAMMCDLAEGMDHQDVQNAATAPTVPEPAAKTAQAPNVSTETPRKNSTQTNPGNNEETNKLPFMFAGIDPIYAKAGVDALKGFSEVFGKLLDPLGITVDVDVRGDQNAANESGSKANTADNEKTPTRDTTPEKKADEAEQMKSQLYPTLDAETPIIIDTSPSVSPPTPAPVIIEYSSISSNESNYEIRVFASNSSTQTSQAPKELATDGMDIDLPVADDGASTSKGSTEAHGDNNKRGSTPVEASWTLIGKQFDELEINEQMGGEKAPEVATAAEEVGNAASNSSATSMPPKNINYAQLGKDLFSHIQAEERAKNQFDHKAAASVIHHADKKINNAIIAMMSMGFSNEGGWLTNLLETVDGDIPRALELLHPSN